MPAKSKSQQRLFGMVHNCQKNDDCASDEVKDIAKGISDKDATDFASTKHKGLPNKKKKFKEWFFNEVGTSTASIAVFRMPLMDLSMIRNGDLNMVGSEESKKNKKKPSKKDKDE